MSAAPTLAPVMPAGQSAEHLKVKLRPDLVVQPQFYEGMTHYVIKDPLALKYFRFKIEEYFLLQQFDGKQNLQDVKKAFERKYRPQTISIDDLTRFVAQLHEADVVINFQGDALLTPPGFVEALIARLESDRDALVATPALRLRSEDVRALQAEEAAGLVGGTSVVSDADGHALYFSKKLIPHLPAGALDGALSPVRLHVGVYAYRPEALERYVATPVSDLETLEGLEQLRFLVAGIQVAVVEVETPPFALRELNNPEDVAPVEQALAEAGLE